jgi:hypothetical protein
LWEEVATAEIGAKLTAGFSLGPAVDPVVASSARARKVDVFGIFDWVDMFWTGFEERLTCGCFSFLYQHMILSCRHPFST